MIVETKLTPLEAMCADERAWRALHLGERFDVPAPTEADRVMAMLGPVGVVPQRTLDRIALQLAHQRQQRQGVV